jgi:hypothetical protein
VIWGIEKAQERFNLAHAALGVAQTKLQAFLEEQLDAKGKIRSYGTTTNPSQQLKNKLAQAATIPGGMLTLSVESRAVHDRAVKTLVEEWAQNKGWSKPVACIAIVHPTDAGWKIGTIVEWKRSRFPDVVRTRLFPNAVVVQAHGAPASKEDNSRALPDMVALVDVVHGQLRVRQSTVKRSWAAAESSGSERLVDIDDDVELCTAIRDALTGRL